MEAGNRKQCTERNAQKRFPFNGRRFSFHDRRHPVLSIREELPGAKSCEMISVQEKKPFPGIPPAENALLKGWDAVRRMSSAMSSVPAGRSAVRCV